MAATVSTTSTNVQFSAGLPAGMLFHPLFLHESIWNLIGVAVILFVGRRFQLQWGRLFGVHLIWYGIGRSWLEAIRIDPSSNAFFGIPTNIWASVVAIAPGIALIVVQGIRHPNPEPAAYREGWASKNPPRHPAPGRLVKLMLSAVCPPPAAQARVRLTPPVRGHDARDHL